MNTLPVIIFPHSNVPECDLKRIFPLFGPMTLCRPWFMAPPAHLSERVLENSLIIKNPPDHLKPGDDFKAILSEARNWINQYPDKSYIRSLGASRVLNSEEYATWDIRRIIRDMENPAPDHEGYYATRWHMALHLADEIEDQRRSFNRILRDIKKIRSPLEDSMGESDDLKGIFEDLPGPESENIVGAFKWEAVALAWLGLYRDFLGNHDVLLTFNPMIMNDVKGEWESIGEAGSGAITLKVPDLSHCDWNELVEIKKKFCEGPKFGKFKELVTDPDFRGPSMDIGTRIKNVEDVLPWERSTGEIPMTVAFLPGYNEKDGIRGAGLIEPLSGKVLILIVSPDF